MSGSRERSAWSTGSATRPTWSASDSRCAASGWTRNRELEPLLFAAHGGSFPITVRDVGVIGTVTVSGLPQAQDHALVVEALQTFLGAPQSFVTAPTSGGDALRSHSLLLSGLVLLSFCLRGPLVAVSTVTTDLSADLGMSATAVGLLTSLPVLCFGVAAPGASAVISRLGVERAALTVAAGPAGGDPDPVGGRRSRCTRRHARDGPGDHRWQRRRPDDHRAGLPSPGRRADRRLRSGVEHRLDAHPHRDRPGGRSIRLADRLGDVGNSSRLPRPGCGGR